MPRSAGRNFAKTISTGPLSDVGTSLAVQDATLLTTGTFYPFYLVLDKLSATNREVIKISAVVGNTLTISQRYLEGSAALSGITHLAGITVELNVVHQYVQDIWDDLQAITPDDSHLFLYMGA